MALHYKNDETEEPMMSELQLQPRAAASLQHWHRMIAQRDFSALGQGGEIGLPVERRKNGAAHQGSAAQGSQDGAGEPLYGNTATIDKT